MLAVVAALPLRGGNKLVRTGAGSADCLQPSKYARPCHRTTAFSNTPVASVNIPLTTADHAACPSSPGTLTSSTTASMPKPGRPGPSDRGRHHADHSTPYYYWVFVRITVERVPGVACFRDSVSVFPSLLSATVMEVVASVMQVFSDHSLACPA